MPLAASCDPTALPHHVYITGTDTGAGKTHVAVALLHALRTAGLPAVGMKPLASGCEATAAGWRNADALALQQASDPRPPYAQVNPYALRTPTAPEIAAALDGVEVELAPLVAGFSALASGGASVVVEGVGGWLAPLSARLMQLDLVRALELPVVLVVGLQLGCINHSLLSLRALRADGVPLLGWIGSRVDAAFEYSGETEAILRQRIDAPCMGILTNDPDPGRTSATLDLAPLFQARTAPNRLREEAAG